MRRDMKDIVVNSPRVGGSRYKAPRFVVDDESTHLTRMKMRYPFAEQKEMTNRLQVVVHYLESKLGWKWDDIWSDVCSANHSSNFRGQHLRGHILEYVYKVNGHCASSLKGDYCFYNKHPVIPNFSVPDFYLDEENRLCKTKKPYRHRYRGYGGKDKIVDFEGHSYYCHKGVWYQVETAVMETTHVDRFMFIADAFGLCHATRWPINEVRQYYGTSRYPISKRQINSRTIKKLRKHLASKAQAS